MPKGNDKGRKGKGTVRRHTPRRVLSEDQPGPSHPVSEGNDSPQHSQPSQASQTSTASQRKNILKHHVEMVMELSEMFSLKSKDWDSIRFQVEAMEYISPRDMGDLVNSMEDLCKALVKNGVIKLGEYSDLRAILVTRNVKAGDTIDKFTARICQEKTGQPQAKRRKTEYKKREPHPTGKQQTKRQRAGDDQGQKQTKRQRAEDDLGHKQSPVQFSPKIATMIERTKAMIEEDKNGPFIDTKGFRDAKEKLRKNGVVVIKGNTGDGKTTAAIRLILSLIEEQQGRQPLQLHNMEDLDLLPPKSKLITFIDDIFGEKVVHEKDVGEWNKRIEYVLPTQCGDKPAEANFLIITIRNEIFNSLRSHSLENVFVDLNIIDLSSNDYKIRKEKLELLELYKPNKVKFSWKENEKEEIVKYATDIGFPQCCRLFRDNPDLQKERVEFFKKPFYFLNRVLEKLEECTAILFLFLNEGRILAKDLDPNGEKVNKTLLDEAFDIDLKGAGVNRRQLKYKQKVEFVRKSLDSLSGFLVLKEKVWRGDGFVYRFGHDSINATVELLYRQITPIGFIKYCPIKSLRRFTISKSSPDRIMLSPDHYVYMFERIHREWESCMIDHCDSVGSLDHYDTRYRDVYETISSLDVWTESQFIEKFVRWFEDENIDKIDVLNKASRSNVKPCVLYLLSQGVEPNKDTNWLSVVTGDSFVDLDLLKKGLLYITDEVKLVLLNKACSKGFVKCALYLLSQGVKPDMETDWLSLIRKCRNGDADIDILKKVVVYMNGEMKLDLLNKACLHGYVLNDKTRVFSNKRYLRGFVDCALYLLSEGVKPDKDTKWWSLIKNDQNVINMDILKKVVVYMNGEMKLNLLNKLCFRGFLKCALYLLSQGVKPDNDTDWLSLVKRGRCGDIDILKKVFIYLNDKMKLDLLNEACLDGLVKCALYLLSEGVKPDKDTSWWSLITKGRGDADDLGVLYQKRDLCFGVRMRKIEMWDINMGVLKKSFTYMNDEIKVNLLNEACSHGFVKCALYVLSKGVKPDKDTDWLSLIKTHQLFINGVALNKIDVDMDILKSVVVYMNDEMKLDLLNKACLEGLVKCALYLLSEGVKPAKDTDWWSLIKNDQNVVEMDILKKVVVYMNDEMKLDLLNKACSHGSVKCALYLLSEGVKPDKDTDWWSLIKNDQNVVDMDILKNVVVCKNDEMKFDVLNKICAISCVKYIYYLLSQGVGKDTDRRPLINKGRFCFCHHGDQDKDVLKKVEGDVPYCVGMDILKKVLIHMNDEMKLDLLNVACCHNFKGCVLYLLSEDVECEENTPFCVVKTGNVDLLRNIVSDITDEIKLVLLNVTCYTGLEECAVYLLSEGAKPDKSTLFCAVIGGKIDVLCKLLQYDIIPTRSTHLLSLLGLINLNVLHMACVFKREEMAKVLCNTYPELALDTDGFGQNTLQFAADTGNCGIFHTVERVILKSLYRVEDERHQCESIDGGVVHRTCVCAQYMSQLLDRLGDTILNEICRRGHMKLCVYICQSYPALTTAVDAVGMTALHVACMWGQVDICNYMCQSYPELTTAVDECGHHFLHYLAEFISDVSVFTECENCVKQYLESTGRVYDITTLLDNEGRTVLHKSCENGHKELCVHLCQSYAEFEKVVDKNGKTVLHVSCERGNKEICKYLCKRYPELTTVVDKDGCHCLHYIAKYTSDVNMFTECEVYVKQYLESQGLQYDIRTIFNNSGESVCGIALCAGNKPLFDYLFQLINNMPIAFGDMKKFFPKGFFYRKKF